MGVTVTSRVGRHLKIALLSVALAACATTSTGTVPYQAMVAPPPPAPLTRLPMVALPVTPVIPVLPAPAPDFALQTDTPEAGGKPRAKIVVAKARPTAPPKVDLAALPPAEKIERPAPVVPPPAPPPPALPSTGMALGGAVPAPMGFTGFCRAYPGSCAATPAAARQIALNARSLAELREVNAGVNDAIWPAHDDYDEDIWSIAPDAGDCDDYAVTKRDTLIRMGYAPSALLLTTARTERGEKHLVLVVSTDQGDLVLDNRVDEIRDWRDVRYTWEARQSSVNPKIWQTVTGGPAEVAAIR